MLFDDEQQILLLEHVFRADNGWGADWVHWQRRMPEAALRRELREEVSIEIDDVSFVCQNARLHQAGGNLLSRG
jgi:8-oxo-dGTP pyrophosphatase MutT (NUDIX family)